MSYLYKQTSNMIDYASNIKLLWNNEDTLSAFSPQTIEISNITTYDALIITFEQICHRSAIHNETILIPKYLYNYDQIVRGIRYDGGLYETHRLFNIIENGISFKTGY